MTNCKCVSSQIHNIPANAPGVMHYLKKALAFWFEMRYHHHQGKADKFLVMANKLDPPPPLNDAARIRIAKVAVKDALADHLADLPPASDLKN